MQRLVFRDYCRAAAKHNLESFIIDDFACTNNNMIYGYIKSLNKSKNLPATIFFDSQVASTDIDKANLINCYFYSVFSSPTSLPSTDDLPESSHSLNVIEFTETEVFQALISLDPNKAPGIDGTYFTKSFADLCLSPV